MIALRNFSLGTDTAYNLLLAQQPSAEDSTFFGSSFLILALIALSFGLAAALCAWTVRASMKPFDSIIQQAKTLDPRNLSQRIISDSPRPQARELVDVINTKLERLELEFKNQQRFFSRVSHELRTPLSVLMMESKAFREKLPADSEVLSYVVAVQEESARLHRIVDAFLILTRAASGVRPAVEVSVPAEEIVLESIRRCRADATNRNVRIVPQLDFGSAHEPCARGDVELLCSALENLIRNAIWHSPPEQNVQVQACIDGSHLCFIVSDQGVGVPEECKEQIFELFFRTPQKNSDDLGIGLSIVQAVAQLHGGSVSARNLPGKGCEFTMRLPMAPNAA